jgi:purine nucleoside phosphorylase
MKARVGLIVGSGFSHFPLEVVSETHVVTPFGAPSSPVLAARLGGIAVAGLARHGKSGATAPHRVNYRANLWALREQGADLCMAVNVVGAIDPAFRPGELAVPDQIIDYTWGRESSFAGELDAVVHVDLTEPFDARLRAVLASAIAASGGAAHGGTYGVTQGPRLETAAEIDRLARDGCAMVGMTAMPEAALARELDMPYAICAIAVNSAAGRSPTRASIHDELARYLDEGMGRAAIVLERAIRMLDEATM